MNGERIAFENWLGIKPCGAAHDLAWAAWQARASLPAPQQTAPDHFPGVVEMVQATPEPVGEPWAHLWQHDETGRTKIVMADEVWTASNRWHYVGPLVLGNTRSAPDAPAGMVLVPMTDEQIAECINKAKTSLFDRAGTTSFRIARAVEAHHADALAAAQAKGGEHGDSR